MKNTNVRLKYYNAETVNIHDTIQHAIRGGLASVLGDNYVKSKNKQTGPKYTGKENYSKYLDFNSMYVSAMVQALPFDEIEVCDDNSYTRSNSNTNYIGTIDINYNDELKQKARSIHSFLKRQRGTSISLQIIKMKIKRKDLNLIGSWG